MQNRKTNRSRPDACGKKARKPRLPWTAWAWVVHGFLYAVIAIYATGWVNWFHGVVSENLSFLEFVANHILLFISILFFLAVSITLIVKPYLSGILVFLGKIFGILTFIVNVIVSAVTGSGKLGEIRHALKDVQKLLPEGGERMFFVGVVLGLVLVVILILLYILICLGLGYLIHRLLEWRKHRGKSQGEPGTA